MDFRLLREIGTIARCLDTIADIEYKKYKLEQGQFLYVVRVCEHPGIGQKTLANMLKLDETTTDKAVRKLIKRGYLSKERSEINMRHFKLYPTPRARQIYETLREQEDKATKGALNHFSENEKKDLLVLLSKMRKNVEKDWEIVKTELPSLKESCTELL